MKRIKIWIAKFICKWCDFAGMGNDRDILQLKKDISDYERSVSNRKRGQQ